jgi:hypothetical protein
MACFPLAVAHQTTRGLAGYGLDEFGANALALTGTVPVVSPFVFLLGSRWLIGDQSP